MSIRRNEISKYNHLGAALVDEFSGQWGHGLSEGHLTTSRIVKRGVLVLRRHGELLWSTGGDRKMCYSKGVGSCWPGGVVES